LTRPGRTANWGKKKSPLFERRKRNQDYLLLKKKIPDLSDAEAERRYAPSKRQGAPDHSHDGGEGGEGSFSSRSPNGEGEKGGKSILLSISSTGGDIRRRKRGGLEVACVLSQVRRRSQEEKKRSSILRNLSRHVRKKRKRICLSRSSEGQNRRGTGVEKKRRPYVCSNQR